MLLMLIWLVAAMLFRRRFQFGIRSLLLLVVVVVIPCSWLAVETWQAKRQRAAVEAIGKVGGSVYYQYQAVGPDQFDPNVLPPGPAWLQNLLGNDHFGDVLVADVRGGEVTDELVSRLESFPRLEWLILRGTGVSDAGLERIEALRSLRNLNLDGCPITDGGLKHVAALGKLRSLGLRHTGITDAGLAELESLTQLEELDLAATSVTDRGMDHVRGLTNLRRLRLRYCGITDAGLAQLSDLKNLELLDLRYTQVTANGIEEVERRLPGIQIPNAAPDAAAGEMTPMAADAEDAASVWDRQKLQGTWIETAIQEGSETRKVTGQRFRFKGDETYLLTAGTVGQPPEALLGKFRLDAAKTPKWFDQDVGGRWLLGVYSLEGDTLRLNTAQPGEARPKDFSGASVFKREKGSEK
jgi:uncharacterized protein (TIGR03067 family)